MLQLQCLLRSRPPESETEIELERTEEASEVNLEMVWTTRVTLNTKGHLLLVSAKRELLISSN